MPGLDFSSIRLPSHFNSDFIEDLRKSLISLNSHELSLFRERYPELAAVVNDSGWYIFMT